MSAVKQARFVSPGDVILAIPDVGLVADAIVESVDVLSLDAGVLIVQIIARQDSGERGALTTQGTTYVRIK